MAEAVAATSPLMAALTKIKDSALHVVSQVRAQPCQGSDMKRNLLLSCTTHKTQPLGGIYILPR
jgi:hypothetical protein